MLTIRRYRQTIAVTVFVLTCSAVVYPLTVFVVSWAVLVVVMATGPRRRARAVALAGSAPSEVEWYRYDWEARYGGWLLYSGIFILFPAWLVSDSTSWQSIFDKLFPVASLGSILLHGLYFAVLVLGLAAIPFIGMFVFPGVPMIGFVGSKLILLFAPPLVPKVISASDIQSMEWKHVASKRTTRGQLPSYYRVTLSDGSHFLVFPGGLRPRNRFILRLQRLGITPP